MSNKTPLFLKKAKKAAFSFVCYDRSMILQYIILSVMLAQE